MEQNESSYESPEVYYAELEELYIDEDELDLSSDFEARATLVKLRRLEKDLLKLKRKISTDMRTIRNMFLDESIIEKPKLLGIFSMQKKLTRTQKRKKLLLEREKALEPYKEITEYIDDYIEQIKELRKYIENESLETYAPSEYTKVTKK